MNSKPWILSAVLAFVVVASMSLGAIVATRVGGGGVEFLPRVDRRR